jgi:TonB family protein
MPPAPFNTPTTANSASMLHNFRKPQMTHLAWERISSFPIGLVLVLSALSSGCTTWREAPGAISPSTEAATATSHASTRIGTIKAFQREGAVVLEALLSRLKSRGLSGLDVRQKASGRNWQIAQPGKSGSADDERLVAMVDAMDDGKTLVTVFRLDLDGTDPIMADIDETVQEDLERLIGPSEKAPTDVATITNTSCDMDSYVRALALAKGSGTVQVRLTVRRDGGISDVHVAKSSGDAVLDEAAVKFVSTCRGSPAKKNGLPVDSIIERGYQFLSSTDAE